MPPRTRSNAQFTRRSQALAAMGISMVVLLQEQATFASDTLWDLLRKTSTPARTVSPMVSPNPNMPNSPYVQGFGQGAGSGFGQGFGGSKPVPVTQGQFGSTVVPPKNFGGDQVPGIVGTVGIPGVGTAPRKAPDTPSGPMTMWDVLRKSDTQNPNQVSLGALARGTQLDPLTGEQ